MRGLFDAIGELPLNFSLRADIVWNTFTWPPPPSMNLFWEEFLTAISTMLIVFTTLTGNVGITAGGAFMAGMVTEGLNGILQPDSTSHNNLSM